MRESVFMSGRGGQGVLLAGQIVAQAAMQAGLNVSWYPIYDPEVRGGRTTCMVVVADGPVGSPVAGKYSAALLFDEIAVERHLAAVTEDGVGMINASLAEVPPDSRAAGLPATEMAEDLGTQQATNMVMLGALAAATGMLTVEQMAAALPELISARHHDLIPLNINALEAGYAAYQQCQ